MADESSPGLFLAKPSRPLSDVTTDALCKELGRCPDLAFAHLVEVRVEGEAASLTLFAWLQPTALGSLRAALNLVAESVARALPEGSFVDVVVLNSAPELLPEVEQLGCLLVERDPDERHRALHAAAQEVDETPPRRWSLWPF